MTTSFYWKLTFIICALVAFSVFGASLVLAAEEAPKCTCTSWSEYQCLSPATSCGGELQSRTCRAGTCGGCSGCTPWVTIQTCSAWQTCDAPTHSCHCEGKCLEMPKNPKYYNSPDYSNQPDKNIGNKDIRLPVKLDWDDVAGWGQEGGPTSYSMRITTSTGSFSTTTDKSESIPRTCLLPSSTTSDWGVKACCNTDGTNCGKESDWSLTATSSPELISPYDPDWGGEKKAENVSLPITLNWCGVKEARTYRLNLYVVSEGKKTCHPWLLKIKESKTICEPWLLEKETRDRYQTDELLYSDFPDLKMDFFTKSTEYQWQLKTCTDRYGFLDCGEYGQLWSFKTAQTTLLPASQLYPVDDPTGKNPVGLPLVLQWDDKPGMNSYYYEITPADGGATITGKNTASQSLALNYPQLGLNEAYKWKVKSCWDYEAKQCETAFSQEWRFTTTGRPPQLVFPASGADQAPIPLTLDWEDVPGAGSYVFKIQGDGLTLEKVLSESQFSMAFPEFNIRQEKNYSWQAKTCAWQEAKGACGPYSNIQSFKTFRMPPPTTPSPTNKGLMSTTDNKSVAWGTVTGAKAYQYQIKYLSLSEKETNETCRASAGKDIFEKPATTFVNTGFIELKCLGDYQWQVRACLDQNCEEVGTWSGPWSFSLMEPKDIRNVGGLIPCGRSVDNPKTPWNERESCQFKHIFLMVKIMIDFLLFRMVPIVLVLLTIATGVTFYTSLGEVMTMARVISLWKSAGIGMGIVFFAWTIVNIVMHLIGYKIGIFGNWYQLPI